MTTKSAISFRTTYILFGIVAVLLAGLAIYVWLSDDAKPNPQGILLESFHNIGAKPDQITGLEIERAGAKMVFARQPDGRWKMVRPIKARADSELIATLVHQLLTARREEKNVDIVENLAVHGLDNPAVKITLRRGDRTATLSLGKVSVGGDQAVVYVLTSDQPKKAQATLTKRLSALFKEKAPDSSDTAALVRDLDDFRTRTLLGEGIAPEEAMIKLTSIKLTVGKKVVHLSRNNPDRVWRFEKPEGYGDVETSRPLDKEFNVNKFQHLPKLLSAILTLEVPTADDFLKGPLDLTAMGLDPSNPELLRIDLERDDPIGAETLWISRRDKGDKVYVRYDDEDSAALVKGEWPRLLWTFVQDPSDLRDLTLVKLRQDRVDAVDVIQNGQKAFELRKVAGTWKIYAGDKVNDASSIAINEVLALLSQPRAIKGFPPPDTKDDAMGLDKPAVELRIWEDGIVKAEKEDPKAKPKTRDAPPTRVLIGKPDDKSLVYVRRVTGAGKVDAKMPIALLEIAARDRLAYVQVPLSAFKPADVTRVVIPRGKDVYEIDRLDAARWTIAAPPTKKGKLANADKINSLLQALAVMQPQGITAEKPDAGQLQKFGLDKPAQKIGLQVKGEAGERVWTFGNPIPKTDWVYAKSNQSDFVIKVSKQFAEIASQGELVDPRLYQIQAAEVDSIRLKGWADPKTSGKPQEIVLLRKSLGVWEAPKKDIAFTSSKVEDLLTAILSPRAETIVAEKGKPVEHQGLDVNKGALEITIDRGGGKKTILTLGNIVTKESRLIYAMYDGDIITIKADQLLLDVKAKPAALR